MDVTLEQRSTRTTASGLVPSWRALFLVAVTALGTGCSAAQDEVSTFDRDVRALRQSADVALPVSLPPDLVQAWVTDAAGVPMVNFYSENEPVVTVCTSPASRCAEFMPGSSMRTIQVDGRSVVVALGRSDNPDAPDPELGRRLGRFWADVALTTDIPSWLSNSKAVAQTVGGSLQ